MRGRSHCKAMLGWEQPGLMVNFGIKHAPGAESSIWPVAVQLATTVPLSLEKVIQQMSHRRKYSCILRGISLKNTKKCKNEILKATIYPLTHHTPPKNTSPSPPHPAITAWHFIGAKHVQLSVLSCKALHVTKGCFCNPLFICAAALFSHTVQML